MNKILNYTNVTKKGLIGIFLSLIVIIITIIINPIGSFSLEGTRTIGLLIAFLIILITEALPVVVTSLLFIGLMPLMKVSSSLGVALSGFSQPVVFFTLASFGLAAAFTTTPIAKRILKKILKIFGNSINMVILALMVSTALVSSFISNVPTCAVFSAIAINFINLYEDEKDRKQTGRALMIGIPLASMIGGIMTPAGSSINLIAIGLLEEFNDTTISFVEWMLVGIPIAIILLPIAWFLLCKIYKPVQVNKKMIEDFCNSIEVPEKIGVIEIKTWIITSLMFIFWILSSWIPFFNVMIVTIIGCALLLFPGINVLSVDTFIKENSWDAFFLVGTVLSIGALMNSNGVINTIASLIPTMNLSTYFVLVLIAIIVFLLLIILPVATSLVSIVGTALMVFGFAQGVDPRMSILVVAVCACNCYLLPLDTVTLITFSKGYYSMTDMAKSTSILQILCTFIASGWIIFVGLILGWL